MLIKNQWMLKTSWWNSDGEQDVYIVLKHLPTNSLLIRKENSTFIVERPRDTT